MTGPEHFADAEKHLEASTWQRQQWGEHDRNDGDQLAEDLLDSALWEVRMAHVHATLALADAFAETLKLTGEAQNRAKRMLDSYDR